MAINRKADLTYGQVLDLTARDAYDNACAFLISYHEHNGGHGAGLSEGSYQSLLKDLGDIIAKREAKLPKALTVLELFSGTHVISDAFKAKGHEAYTVDWSLDVSADLHADIGQLTAEQLIALCGGVPDVVWASPDCTTYSVAALGTHRRRTADRLEPRTPYAEQCDRTNAHVMSLIKELTEMNPNLIWFVENPRGAMRKMPWMEGLPRYTVTYCQYGETRMKPTDIWTNHPCPRFRPACRNGDPCHERAPRGSKTGTQGINGKLNRAQIPAQLCAHIVDICEHPEAPADRLEPRQTRLGAE